MPRHAFRPASTRHRSSGFANLAIALASIGVVALAVINVIRA